jgi:flagellar hook capping protein FlgD
MYMWDTNAGTSLFAGGNDASECVWFYERVAIPATILTNRTDITPKSVNDFKLLQNYPNPFNPTTTIKYELSQQTDVRIDIFNILGQSIKTIVNKKLNKGVHEVTWKGLNKRGESVSGGIYFYKLKTSEFQQTKKMLLLK